MRVSRGSIYRGLRSGLISVWVLFVLTAQGADTQRQQLSILAPLATRSLLLDAAISGEAIVAVGERGHVLRSVDQGNSWRQVAVPTRVTLTAVAFYPGGLGFAAGHDATILRTLDGGGSWQQVYHVPEEERPLLDTYILGPQHAIAVGAYGFYLESRDGGTSWDLHDLNATDLGESVLPGDGEELYPDDYHLNQFAVSGNGIWYMAAEAGIIYRSRDRGANWQRLPSPYAGSFMGILPLPEDRVLVFGLQGKLFFSNDGGEDWQQLDTGTQSTLTSALVLRDGRVLVTGYAGSVLTASRDLSKVQLTELEQRMGISAGIQLQNGDLIFFGSGGMQQMPLNELK
jgi:photosystem II stability/assembly factor-like uncharacterized protein